MDIFAPSHLLIILIIVLLAGLASRFVTRGALAISGPVLVLRKFEVNDTGSPAVAIEGRPPGLVAWLFTMLRLHALTTLTVTDYQVLFKSTSLRGEIHDFAPLTQISSTHCAYSQPIWLLILGGAILLVSFLSAILVGVSSLVAGVMFAGALYVWYLLNRKIIISLVTTGGTPMGLSFKPSVIEGVPVDLARALRAVHRINHIVLARARALPAP